MVENIRMREGDRLSPTRRVAAGVLGLAATGLAAGVVLGFAESTPPSTTDTVSGRIAAASYELGHNPAALAFSFAGELALIGALAGTLSGPGAFTGWPHRR